MATWMGVAVKETSGKLYSRVTSQTCLGKTHHLIGALINIHVEDVSDVFGQGLLMTGGLAAPLNVGPLWFCTAFAKPPACPSIVAT